MTALQDPPAAGLVHLGLVYDGVDDMVARCLPEIRRALGEGGSVHAAVERRGVRGLRDALGEDARDVVFPAPAAAFARGTPRYLADLRRRLPRDRRTLIVAQYSPREHPPVWDVRFAEDAVNLVLGDLPLTVMCACDRGGVADHRVLTERAHEHLIDESGARAANPGWTPPPSSTPVPLTPWGEPVASIVVEGPGGLAALRRRLAAIAADAGLVGESRQAAVLAAHEAVLLAGGTRPEVRVRTRGRVLVTEVLAADGGDTAPGAEWRAEHLPRFCDRMSMHDGPGGRLVRVLSS